MNTLKSFFTLFLILIIYQKSAISQDVVMLDNYFNHETNSKTGKIYHYTWNDEDNSGFSQFGGLFVKRGVTTITLENQPTRSALRKADIYIIVDPDTTTENSKPNYVLENHIITIRNWVRKGGVLLLMANDRPNCEFTHFNQLANEFGFHFVPKTLNPVINRNWEMGAEINLPNHPLFTDVSKIYMKEVAPIILSKAAKPVLKDEQDIFIAETKYGKGYVLAIGDPWIYNEYIGHKMLPASFENMKAAENLVTLLLDKTTK